MKRRSFLKGLATIFGLSLIELEKLPAQEVEPEVPQIHYSPYFVEGSVWQATKVPEYNPLMIVCDYCESRNDYTAIVCVSCGGPLRSEKDSWLL